MADFSPLNLAKWIEEHRDASGGKPAPFLLWAHYVEPHEPYRFQRQFADRLGIDGRRQEVPPTDRYDTEVAWVDARTGDFLDAVFERVPRRETLVVFVADHVVGGEDGHHGRRVLRLGDGGVRRREILRLGVSSGNGRIKCAPKPNERPKREGHHANIVGSQVSRI